MTGFSQHIRDIVLARADHYCGTGACEWLVDEFPCYCPRYEWQGDQ